MFIGKARVPPDPIHSVHRPRNIFRPGCNDRANVAVDFTGDAGGGESQIERSNPTHADCPMGELYIFVFRHDKADVC